ncbi:hypothetical protein Taro_015740 [Colocasia esculenta]|uniref:Uncharacterized protein n=1 Tax=Colocasia esculenta TaxID=4460 RepID=A0A843UU44_COLES|nr:hypothetical protein [Colocasia esculenta]
MAFTAALPVRPVAESTRTSSSGLPVITIIENLQEVLHVQELDEQMAWIQSTYDEVLLELESLMEVVSNLLEWGSPLRCSCDHSQLQGTAGNYVAGYPPSVDVGGWMVRGSASGDLDLIRAWTKDGAGVAGSAGLLGGPHGLVAWPEERSPVGAGSTAGGWPLAPVANVPEAAEEGEGPNGREALEQEVVPPRLGWADAPRAAAQEEGNGGKAVAQEEASVSGVDTVHLGVNTGSLSQKPFLKTGSSGVDTLIGGCRHTSAEASTPDFSGHVAAWGSREST